MALITITNRNDLLNELMLARVSDDIIQLAPGIYEEFIWPRSVTRPLTLKPQSISNPPTMRGMLIGGTDSPKGNFAHLGNQPKASRVDFLTLDGLRFEAQRFTQARDQGGTLRSITVGGRGIGWRTAGTTHPSAPFAGYSENSNYRGLVVSSGVHDFHGTNLTFDGYANALWVSGGGNSDILFDYIRFVDNHEDLIKYTQFLRITFEYIEALDFMGIPPNIAAVQGWGRNDFPHADFFQQMGAGTGLTIRKCFLYDDTGHVHVGLFRPPDGNPLSHDMIYDNIEAICNHEAGMAVKDAVNVTVTHCKISMPPGVRSSGPSAGPVIQIEPASTSGTLNISNNMALRLQGRAAGAPGSSTNNNNNTYPSGFTQFRKEKVDEGDPYAGPYGQGGVEPPPQPTKPLTLTLIPNDFVFHAWTRDPDLPLSDNRRVPIIAIRTTSKAKNAVEIRWQNTTDPGARRTVEIGVGSNGERLFRMASDGDFHRVVPGSSMTFGVFWVATEAGVRSDRSSVDETTPTLPGVAPAPPPVFVDVPDFTLALAVIHEGNDILAWVPDGYRTPVWTKP